MIEEAGSNDPQVEEMENTADELAHHGDKLQDDIENTHDDWESKKESQAVPGAVPDPDDEAKDDEAKDDKPAEDDDADEDGDSDEDT